ncbi:MAG TPA: DUF6232 family protein [Natronosporangium sp.]
MTVFYRGPCVRVTHEVFETRCPHYRAFYLPDLRDIEVMEFTVDPPATVASARVGSTGMAGAVAVIMAIGQAEGWDAMQTPLTMLGLMVLLVASAATSGACWLVRPVEQELVAEYRGASVSLYRSADAREFGQVRRALLRAIENLGETW